jgi:hypothetical protein
MRRQRPWFTWTLAIVLASMLVALVGRSVELGTARDNGATGTPTGIRNVGTTTGSSLAFGYDAPDDARVVTRATVTSTAPSRRAAGALGSAGEWSSNASGSSMTPFVFGVATNTASGASRTQLFRSVEPGELADLVGGGQFRTIAGQEGKYFFPTHQQAAAFDDIISGQAAVTSGKINSSLLSGVEQITISGEGAAWFIPEELLPYIDDIVIHGAP